MAESRDHQADLSPSTEEPGPVAQALESGDPCPRCGAALVIIRLNIDGNNLVMESCETCDVRRWHLDGEQIDRNKAIAEVGVRAGRRR